MLGELCKTGTELGLPGQTKSFGGNLGLSEKETGIGEFATDVLKVGVTHVRDRENENGRVGVDALLDIGEKALVVLAGGLFGGLGQGDLLVAF